MCEHASSIKERARGNARFGEEENMALHLFRLSLTASVFPYLGTLKTTPHALFLFFNICNTASALPGAVNAPKPLSSRHYRNV